MLIKLFVNLFINSFHQTGTSKSPQKRLEKTSNVAVIEVKHNESVTSESSSIKEQIRANLRKRVRQRINKLNFQVWFLIFINLAAWAASFPMNLTIEYGWLSIIGRVFYPFGWAYKPFLNCKEYLWLNSWTYFSIPWMNSHSLSLNDHIQTIIHFESFFLNSNSVNLSKI